MVDCVAQVLQTSSDWSKAQVIVLKLLSVDPLNYQDAPREAIRRVLVSIHSPLCINIYLCILSNSPIYICVCVCVTMFSIYMTYLSLYLLF